LVDGTGKTKKNVTAARRLYTIAARKGNRAAMDKLRTFPPPQTALNAGDPGTTHSKS
jgi:TPR repeat protein